MAVVPAPISGTHGLLARSPWLLWFDLEKFFSIELVAPFVRASRDRLTGA
jgi:hypothetical protein